MLIVVIPNAIKLSVVMLIIIRLGAIVLSVVKLIVIRPRAVLPSVITPSVVATSLKSLKCLLIFIPFEVQLNNIFSLLDEFNDLPLNDS
jgi:hypothetical protein